MRFRKLRIAWSVGCGISCLLLIALWVRGHQAERIQDGDSWEFFARSVWYQVHSAKGLLLFTSTPKNTAGTGYEAEYFLEHGDNNFAGVGYRRGHYSLNVHVPYWLTCLAFALAALLPWFSRCKQFSLRTLLITTTLVAVVLGLIGYVTRQ